MHEPDRLRDKAPGEERLGHPQLGFAGAAQTREFREEALVAMRKQDLAALEGRNCRRPLASAREREAPPLPR